MEEASREKKVFMKTRTISK